MLNDPSGPVPTPKGSQPVLIPTAPARTATAIVLLNRQLNSKVKTFEQEGGPACSRQVQ